MRTLDYYLTTVLKDTKKTGSHCAATASRFAPFFLNICAKLLEPLGHQRSSVDGLITPTLKAAGSNPVGRTKKGRFHEKSSFFIFQAILTEAIKRSRLTQLVRQPLSLIEILHFNLYLLIPSDNYKP